MFDFFRRMAQTATVGIGLTALIVITYNNWLLGPYLNRDLFAHNGSVSEFSAITQPHFWVFRSLDILSGLLLTLLAYVMAKRMPTKDLPRNILIYGTTVLGLANIADASFVLPCSETLNAACQIPVSLRLSHFHMPGHGYSSVVIAACYLLLPMAGFTYAAQKKLNLLLLFSGIATAVALEALLSVSMQYLVEHRFSIRASGVSQEIQMLILGAWFIAWAVSVYAKSTALAPSKSRLYKDSASETVT